MELPTDYTLPRNWALLARSPPFWPLTASLVRVLTQISQHQYQLNDSMNSSVRTLIEPSKMAQPGIYCIIWFHLALIVCHIGQLSIIISFSRDGTWLKHYWNYQHLPTKDVPQGDQSSFFLRWYASFLGKPALPCPKSGGLWDPMGPIIFDWEMRSWTTHYDIHNA